jgi:hypothetical protein
MRLVRYLSAILLVLSLPAGALGYALGTRMVEAVAFPEPVQGILALFLPLFIGGLFMIPFVAVFFDRMAKRDLAARPQNRGGKPNDKGRR